MVDIPPFDYEDLLTSDKYYQRSILFELICEQSGVKKSFTENWKDVYDNLKDNEYFGVKLSRGREVQGGCCANDHSA